MIRDEHTLPWAEEARLAALARYAVLGTAPEKAIDDIVAQAAELLDCPVAAVNLIGDGRQFFRAARGLKVGEMRLADSICARALHEPDMLVVPDASLDPRFSGNALVTGSPGLRFYACALLKTPDGLPLGALCVIDTAPRPAGLNAQQRFILQTLADRVMAHFETRRQDAAAAAEADDTERRLRTSEQRYRTVLNSIDEGFCIIEMIFDAQGDPCDYRILEINPAFALHTGLKDAVGKTIRELIPTHDVRWSRIYGRVARTGLPVRIQQHTANLGRWLEVYASRIGEPERFQVAVFLRDITEERQGAEALQQLADGLADANRRQSEFLATLAHELRNPLAPVRTGLDLLRIGAGKPGVLERVRPMMERQINHLVHLVDDLLDLARINSGKIELKKTDVALKDVLLRAIEMTQPLIDARGHAFSHALPDEGLLVHADPTRLAQVVGNLLANAAKYTPAGGQLALRARREGVRVRVEVKDSGIGIPAADLPRIFDMFTQVGRHPEQETGGLGIGLHLVRQMTELHGGSVRAASAGAGQGSVFTLELPLAGTAPVAPGAPPPGRIEAPARLLNILLADDNLDAAALLRDVLELDGHTVKVAANGAEALALAAGFVPDIAFLDIGMPGLNGYEVARRLRADPRLAQTMLVAVTGWGTQEDRARSEAAGFDRHLTKPVSLDALHGLIRACARASASR